MGNTTPMGISLAPPVFCANTAAPRPSPITSPIIRMTTSVAARPFRAALGLVFVAPPFMAALFFAMNLHMATHLPCILVPAQPWPHPLAIARFCQLPSAYHGGGRSFSWESELFYHCTGSFHSVYFLAKS